MTQKSDNQKHSLFHIEASQFITLHHNITSCALNTEDLIPKNFLNSVG
jgi:hypothetical protein